MKTVKAMGGIALAASALILSLPLVAADQSASSGRGTLKGGSEYEQQMRQSGMEGMSGMSGNHSMTSDEGKKAKHKAKKKAKKASAAAESEKAPAQ